LLTHTAGLPNYTDFVEYEAGKLLPATPEQLVALFRDQPLEFAPGTGYHYGNSDYVLLGVIVERVSRQPYADFVRENIFAPLKMSDSGFASDGDGEWAQGYQSFSAPAPALDPSTLYSAGGLFSTVEDLYRWDQALYTDQLLPMSLRDIMFKPSAQEYGYGWKISRPGGRLQIGHAGLMDGFASYMARYPDDRVTIIVLSNMDSADPPGISAYLATLVFDS
jgi:CubicO group peptidase (beta-lactamase class C family)